MIICLCKGISDRIINELIEDGTTAIKEIKSKCGLGQGCGKCVVVVKRIIDEKKGLLSKKTCDNKCPHLKTIEEMDNDEKLGQTRNRRSLK